MAVDSLRVPRVHGVRQTVVTANAQMAMAMAVMLGMATMTANVGTTKNGPKANGPKANGAPVDGAKAKVGRTAVAVPVCNHGTNRAPVCNHGTTCQ